MKTDESLVKEVVGFPEKARALVVNNDKTLELAGEELKGSKALQKKIREWFKPHKTKARDALNGLIAEEKRLLDPLQEFERIVKGKMAPYMEEQARKVREAEEAREKAQKEAEEAERKAEEDRQKKAREALQDGDQKKAEKILAEEPKEIIPEQVDIPVTKTLEGTHATRRWTYEVTNIELVPRPLLMLDKVAVNKIVQEKQKDAKIPGIRIFQKTGISSGG